ncbi:MAG: hypothetical protein Q8M03_10245 [Legionella sp.]|nr:hypothetical protein [Legionella sp.]
MRELVQNLVDNIRKLPEPTFLVLSEILTPHRASFETDVIPPEEYAAHWHLIRSLIKQLDEAHDILQSEQQVALERNSFANRSERLKQNKTTIRSKKATIAKHLKVIDEHYAKLHGEYRDNIPESESHRAVLNSSDHNSRIEVLESLSKTLRVRQVSLKLEEMRLLLNEKSTRKNDIIKQLLLFSIDISSLEAQALQGLIEKKHERYTVLSNLKNEFESLRFIISNHIAALNVELMIAELRANIRTVELSHHETVKSLNTLTNNVGSQEALRTEYLKAKANDKEAFIESKKVALNCQKSSYLNWMISKDYLIELQRLENEYAFVQLLHKEQSQLQHREALNTQLQETISKSQIVSRADDDLAIEATRLLKIYKSDYSSEDKSLQILLSDMVEYTIPLHAEIDELHTSIVLLNELQEIDNTILRLRTDYSLISDLDDESILSLKATANTRQDELKGLDLKLNTIALCVNSLETITTLEKSISERREENKRLIKENKQGAEYIKQASQMQSKISSLLNELRALPPVIVEEPQMQSDVASLLENLRAMPSVEPTPAFALESEPVRNEIFPPENPYAETLGDWNNKIRALTHLLPKDLSLWYEKLYSVLLDKACDESSFHQICQLLRDIYFELQYPINGDNFSVLRAYQKMSPAPDEDCQAVIDMKLPFPVDMPLLEQFDRDDIADAFKNLYTQQKLLEKKHSREALLLLQATHNLHQLAAIQSHEHSALANLKTSMNDPRYKSLHDHRGFLKVSEWLAKLVTALLNIVKTQPENSYRQRFFFVPTRSTKLLEATTQEVISCSA